MLCPPMFFAKVARASRLTAAECGLALYESSIT
jgi:hypothetical protein